MFITNESTNNLRDRLKQLIPLSTELNILVGFFYLSGLSEIIEELRINKDLKLKVLVGLDVDEHVFEIVKETLSDNEREEAFTESLRNSVKSPESDGKSSYIQINFFKDLIKEDRLVIRKTAEPNHAKIYIFKHGQFSMLKEATLITGSSNLSRSGLSAQNEFNVELSDYGTQEAEDYFNDLWSNSVMITEIPEVKEEIIKIIENESLVTQITPFEAYCLILSSYLETQQVEEISRDTLQLAKSAGYELYSYQTDAVKQGLSVIDVMNGVIIADVVGLGKSVIASFIAKELERRGLGRGLILCPPGLVGDRNDKSGWRKYRKDFKLFGYEVRSSGDLENVNEYVKNNKFDVVIIDEAHAFRNQDTQRYEWLSYICKNKKVILLTATPFNNTPNDIFSLLKLFEIPGKSRLTLENDLQNTFANYTNTFKKLSEISKYYDSSNESNRIKASNNYKALFGSDQIDLEVVRKRVNYLSSQIRQVIEPVLIRRNRIDLLKDPIYSQERIIENLSTVSDPEKLFFELTVEQSHFYDQIINEYFGEEGRFKGAIYRPYFYEGISDSDDNGAMEENIERNQQTNLYNFMRRLLVKRFESSFGAFNQSIKNFKRTTELVLEFIENSGYKYILDRSLLEKIYDYDEDGINEELERFQEKLIEKNLPKKNKIYNVQEFSMKEEFLSDIRSDLTLFSEIEERLNDLNLIGFDPKGNALLNKVNELLSRDSQRKIIIFSEYADTVTHLTNLFDQHFKGKFLSVSGDIPSNQLQDILANFDTTYEDQEDTYQVIITTDKLSEGFNLNRAGIIFNYDIPWNPTRVIQRLGRINRISKKVFDQLYIYNCFPSEKGADIVKSEEIASQKMFVIHNTLGEDSKIFSTEEQVSASALYHRINENPEKLETESFQTQIRQEYFRLKEKYPEIINRVSDLPTRLKVGKKSSENILYVFTRKGLGLFISSIDDKQNLSNNLTLQAVLPSIRSTPEDIAIELSEVFWENYEKIRYQKDSVHSATSETSIEVKAENNLKFANEMVSGENRFYPLLEFRRFIETLYRDILDYKTLSKATLRKIANIDLKDNSEAGIEKIVEQFGELRTNLGENYLESIESQTVAISKEIIVAIENQKAN